MICYRDSLPCSDKGQSPFFCSACRTVAVSGMEVRAGHWFSWLVHSAIRKELTTEGKKFTGPFKSCFVIKLILKGSVLVTLLNKVCEMTFVWSCSTYYTLWKVCQERVTVIYWWHDTSIWSNTSEVSSRMISYFSVVS